MFCESEEFVPLAGNLFWMTVNLFRDNRWNPRQPRVSRALQTGFTNKKIYKKTKYARVRARERSAARAKIENRKGRIQRVARVGRNRRYSAVFRRMAEAPCSTALAREHLRQGESVAKLIKRLEQGTPQIGDMHLIQADDLWPLTSTMANLAFALSMVMEAPMDALHRLEARTGRRWYNRPG